LDIARTLSEKELIEEYETMAGELTQWLAQFDSLPVAAGKVTIIY
jgi:hypothetical protein